MNLPYVDKLLEYNRTGLLIRYIEDNVHDFSVENLKMLISKCSLDRFDIYYYMMEICVRKIKYKRWRKLYVMLPNYRCLEFNNYLALRENCDYDKKQDAIYEAYSNIDILKSLLSNEFSIRYPLLDLCFMRKVNRSHFPYHYGTKVNEKLLTPMIINKYKKFNDFNYTHTIYYMANNYRKQCKEVSMVFDVLIKNSDILEHRPRK